MMIADEDPAFLSSTHRALTLFEPAVHEHHRDWTSPPHIRPSIEGIAEDVADEALRGDFPNEPGALNRVRRQFDLVIPKPLKRLTHAPELSEFGEHQLYGFANTLVGVKRQFFHRVEHIPNRQPLKQLAATRFRFLSRLHPLA